MVVVWKTSQRVDKEADEEEAEEKQELGCPILF
jgi:hypothetical protein